MKIRAVFHATELDQALKSMKIVNDRMNERARLDADNQLEEFLRNRPR